MTVTKINPITVSGIDNPYTIWEVVAEDHKGRQHRHRINDTEFKQRIKTNNWWAPQTADLFLWTA